MAVNEYKLPDVGEGLTEAEIVSWKVKVGDVIKVNDIVVEIETAKSLVELPSPYAGTVVAVHVPEGETVPVGTPIIAISDGADAPAPAPTAEDGAGGMGEIDMSNPAATGGGENQTLVGYGPRSGSAMRRARRGPATAASDAGAAAQIQVQGTFEAPGIQHTTEVVPATEQPVPATQTEPAHAGELRTLAKPPVRKLAKDLGIDLRSVTPTGPGGTVTRQDVEAASAGATAAPTSRTAPVTGGERREPIKGVRKMMGQAMVQSAFTLPHVTEWITVDVTRTMELVARLKERREFRDVKVSPLLVLAKAVCLAMRRTPELNAWWDDAAQEIVYKDQVNLGIAAATPRGLVVPNVKGAESLSMVDLAKALNELTVTAREGKTQPADMSGGTFTITNVGVFGVDAGTPIINPGESAIIAFGAVRKQPWVVGDQIVPRDITTLALSFDHRFIDGALGSQFLADVAGLLEDPATALVF